jgi:hypothetical protein
MEPRFRNSFASHFRFWHHDIIIILTNGSQLLKTWCWMTKSDVVAHDMCTCIAASRGTIRSVSPWPCRILAISQYNVWVQFIKLPSNYHLTLLITWRKATPNVWTSIHTGYTRENKYSLLPNCMHVAIGPMTESDISSLMARLSYLKIAACLVPRTNYV